MDCSAAVGDPVSGFQQRPPSTVFMMDQGPGSISGLIPWVWTVPQPVFFACCGREFQGA